MHPKTILLVDDNALQATIRRTILERSGYTIITALQPAGALDRLQSSGNSAHSDEISLVITDHIMPGMNGSAFVREIRSQFPELPVLVISGMEEATSEYEGLNVEFRTKPLQPDILLKCVQQLLHVPDSAARPESVTTQASA